MPKMDKKLVSAKQDHEVKYLVKKFKAKGKSKEEVLAAVKAVGHSREKVEEYLLRTTESDEQE